MDNCLKANEQIQNQTREGDLSEVLRQVRQDEGLHLIIINSYGFVTLTVNMAMVFYIPLKGGDASRQEFTMFLQPEQVTSQWSLSDVGVSSPDGGARYEQHVIDGGDSRGYAVPGPTQHYAQISGDSSPFITVFRPPDTFSVGVSSQNKSSKNLDYVVGLQVGVDGTTLYCKADVMVPFIFTQPRNHYRSGAVRIKAEYIEDRYASRAVERCPNHRFKDGWHLFNSSQFYAITSFALSCNKRPTAARKRDMQSLFQFAIPLDWPLPVSAHVQEVSTEELCASYLVWKKGWLMLSLTSA
uniref:P53 domain-containing protein n=1 Tax=Heterorhabditis bacteriophora TaxID=37862 RepID=A0A1I7WNA7_HETBA